MLPETKDRIVPKLMGSAEALAQSCTGMGNNTCGVRWYSKKWDGWNGMEEDISAACGFSAPLLLDNGKQPVSWFTGGNSTSNPAAGEEDDRVNGLKPITAGDKAGAGIVTAFFVSAWVGLVAWMILGD